MIVPIIGIYCINQPISTNHIILDISQTGTDVTELVAAFGKAAVAFFPGSPRTGMSGEIRKDNIKLYVYIYTQYIVSIILYSIHYSIYYTLYIILYIYVNVYIVYYIHCTNIYIYVCMYYI